MGESTGFGLVCQLYYYPNEAGYPRDEHESVAGLHPVHNELTGANQFIRQQFLRFRYLI